VGGPPPGLSPSAAQPAAGVPHHSLVAIEIELPDASLVVLVGAAGAGKSTLASRHFAPSEVLSSDAFRARIGKGEDDQDATGPAFRALHAALRRRLGEGRLTVVDATNVRHAARRALIRRADQAQVPAVAIVLDLGLEACLDGDLERAGRHVDPSVIRRQWSELQASLARPDGLLGEGFVAVHRLTRRKDVDDVAVHRWPTIRPSTVPTGALDEGDPRA
jgi:protein phosphatase